MRLCRYLKTISLDRNNITIEGFSLLISALIDNALKLNDIRLHVSLIGNPIIVQKVTPENPFSHIYILREEAKLIQEAEVLNIRLRLR